MKNIPDYLLYGVRPAEECRASISLLLLLSPQECRSPLATLSKLESLADLRMEHVYAVLPGDLSICSASLWWKHPTEDNRHRRQDCLMLLQAGTAGRTDILATASEHEGTTVLDMPCDTQRHCANMRQALLELYDIAGEMRPTDASAINRARAQEQCRLQAFEHFLQREDVVHAGWRHGRFATYGVRQVLIRIENLVSVARNPYSDDPLPYCFHHERKAPVLSLRRTKSGGYALVDMHRQSKAWAKSGKAAWRMLLRYLPKALDGEITAHQRMSLLEKSRLHPISKGLLTLSEAGGDPRPALFDTIYPR